MKLSTVLFLASVLCLPSLSSGQQIRLIALSKTVVLPEVQGGFNHMSVDAGRQRLFAAAPTNGTLEVVDLSSGKPFKSLRGEKPAAVLYAPEFDQLYVSRGQSVVIYDGKTLQPVTSVDLQSNLDELQYDPRAHELYAGCMSEGRTGIAVISVPEGRLLGKIALPAKPQGIAVEREGGRLFANMPSLKQVAVVDRSKRVALEPWPLENVEGNTPIGLDEANHRLFVGARRPAQLLVLDTGTGKAVKTVEMNSDADDLFYVPKDRAPKDGAAKGGWIYVSCGEGIIDLIEQFDADRYQLMARVPTVAGARTSTFSAGLNSLIVGVPRRGDQPAEIRVFKTGR